MLSICDVYIHEFGYASVIVSESSVIIDLDIILISRLIAYFFFYKLLKYVKTSLISINQSQYSLWLISMQNMYMDGYDKRKRRNCICETVSIVLPLNLLSSLK